MCYSGECVWENFMGECRYPRYDKEITNTYGDFFCNAPLNEYFTIIKILKKNKLVKERNIKINRLKNKLSYLKNNI